MSTEAIKEFYNYVQTQPEIQSELNSLRPQPEVMVDRAVEIAKSHGYIFSGVELAQVIKELDAAKSQEEELSDEQLEAVAGGAAKDGSFEGGGQWSNSEGKGGDFSFGGSWGSSW